MQQSTTIRRLLGTAGLALVSLMAGCAAPGVTSNRVVPTWADEALARSAPVAPARLASVPLAPQDDIPPMDQVHPRTMITFGVGIGEQTNEINTGLASQIVTSSTDSQRLRLRGEHYFESGFGIFGEGYIGFAEDINEDLGSSDSSQDSVGLFVAGAFRATIDDDFRLPVRLGPFFQMTESDDVNFVDGAVERTTVGVRLSAEPEYIIFQSNRGGRIAELSAFGEIRAGAGPTDVEDNVDSEDAYAFTLDYEFGLRYRFRSGFLASLSYVASKYHVGATESFNNPSIQFRGIDDDFNGVMLTAGMRF